MSGNYSGHGFSNMKFIATASSNEDFDRWVAEVRSAPDALSFEQFKTLAAPSKNAPVQHFSSVEPLLFKKVIDQFIGVGENTAAAAPAGTAAGAQASQE